MSFDPYAPYGPVVTTTLRVVTWNVWGRYGQWEERQAGIEAVLSAASPDIVCLVESWSTDDDSQAAQLAKGLGMENTVFSGDWDQEGWQSGLAVVSRWPIASHESRTLPGHDGAAAGQVLFTLVEGPRGPVQLFVVVLDYPLDGSGIRQAQVRHLAGFVDQRSRRRHPTVVCGDFNSGPDSDEIRMLTGRSAPPVPGLVFYDAWEMAGDGTAGTTWSNANPLAAVGLYPDRRFDYVLSAWPRAGGVGHPVRCERLGVLPPEELQLSDHYGVLADLRY